MDMHKSAATRVRHILQAMERSIDSARSRRVVGVTPAVPPVPPTPLERSMNTPIGGASRAEPNAALPRNSAAPGVAASTAGNQVIGAASHIAAQPATPPASPSAGNDPAQPARLKAKPKRFESTFAAQYAQPTYRSQTG
jgi:hypothetical protein